MKKQTYLIVIAFFSIYVFWGSTYLWNKIAVTELPPFMLASMRFSSAGLIIFTIARSMGLSLKISKKEFLNCLLAGFLFLGYGNGVFVWALKYVDSSFGALLASIQPIVILLLMRLWHRNKIKSKSIIGITLGIIGMYLLVSQKGLVLQERSVLGIIMIFTCIISWSIGSVFVAQAAMPKNFFITTGYQMLTAGITLAFASLFMGEFWSNPMDWSTKTQGSLIALILFGSIAAFTSFNYLLKVVSTEKVSTSAYVNPIVALLLGWYFLDEVITLQTTIAAIILLAGVYFINSAKKGKKYT
ncbi:EamA family transporter [Dokdonia pacifica]|uniref:Permease of the drug/metabolite transporter (DMT) superfamily n=1 Tax=Dokdonia pacifica TaxID=1627892 RepID=A0A239DDL6_9FLAO|nr:EamA family transporter [Dokdonia pacifica]SNS30526.1 Permease of the drug/metabolite transporter (DMT) superfamily [Dokdonia pacifica]